MRRIIILLFFLFFTQLLLSQVLNSINGRVLDEVNLTPLVGVSILLSEAKVGTVTDVDGNFVIQDVPSGNYTIRFSYIGHATEVVKVKVPSEASQNLEIIMIETAIHLKDVVITGNPFRIDAKDLSKPLVTLSRLELDLVRNKSVGEMLNFQPGVSMVSNGSAVSRPVIRGFGSSRVIILEDGLRMGDLSASSSDHSVTEDGSNPDRIEIIRGAPALLYSSSSPGGIVNIISDFIPVTIPDNFMGNLMFGGNSVSNQKYANAELFYGSGRMSYQAGGFYKKGNDYNTPLNGRIMNSSLEGFGFRGGLSMHPSWGMAGAAVNTLNSTYGIPYDIFSGDEEGPVYLDMRKTEYRFLTQLDSVSVLIPQVGIKGGLQDYSHEEKSRLTEEIGSRFALKTLTGDIYLRHKLLGSSDNLNGIIGTWFLNQKYSVRGEEALTPNADYLSLAAYLFQEIELAPFIFQGALRFEQNKINIPEAVLSDSLFQEDVKQYASLSGALGISLFFSEQVSMFSNFTLTNRSPGVEELSAYAIHPATASFDIGKRNLNFEKNYALEAGIRFNARKLYIELNGYYNSINNYIYRNPLDLFYNNTGFNNISGFKVYEYTQTEAEIYGAEIKGILDIADGLSFTLTSDYVRGKYRNSNENLPLIPPFRISFDIKYIKDYHWAGISIKAASSQNTVALNENPTKGYGVIDLFGGFKLISGTLIHQIDLKIENLFNQEYRDHLSALKNFAPMPGRNFLVSYRLLF